MRRFTQISLMLAALCALMTGDVLLAKGDRGEVKDGGGKSRNGGSSFQSDGGSGKSRAGAIYPGKGKHSSAEQRGETKPSDGDDDPHAPENGDESTGNPPDPKEVADRKTRMEI